MVLLEDDGPTHSSPSPYSMSSSIVCYDTPPVFSKATNTSFGLLLLPEVSWVFVTVSRDCWINPLRFLLTNYMVICWAPRQHGFNHPGAPVSSAFPSPSTGIRVVLVWDPRCLSIFFFFHHSPGPKQMVRLCWLSSLLLCFHGNMGHRDHVCLGLSDSILWLRTWALWPLLFACLLSWGLREHSGGPGSWGHFRDPLRTYSPQMVVN
jgi:hypothetical protein